ncbi:beta-glucosidase [Sulfolobus sp. A20]|nr:beta-glucosidase [Sulfolobus sp. A20]TRM77305.1 beta-glucosidase [Sulfolobus sp. A20-N-F8]TRM89025.1 beta-glucosidase [Sulfolobus sp. C3]TRM97345.1 beta-glucosidase [Sulfolobus sp. B1]TRN04070.1 beta-glucosidase [Sulfolobus sp. F1]
MKIEEKVAQLGSIQVNELLENNEFSEEKAEKLLRYGIGEITRVVGSNLRPKQAGKVINQIQRYLIEKTRVRIPAIVHEECLSGLMGPTATLFPIPLALSSTWDLTTVSKVTKAIRNQTTILGIRHCLSPVLDLCRDPRWGRCEETFGEDVYLTASMANAYITGLQGNNQLIATAKHFVAHGSPEGGRNTAPVNVGNRELRNVYLYPFEVAVRKSEVLSIMPAYHEIDGVPCHANNELLHKVLREEWGFKGIIVSDYWAVKYLNTVHRVADSCKEAGLLALNAGVNIEFPSLECFRELEDAISSGEIPEKIIDNAVERVLYVKYLIGLFDNPFVDESKIPEILDNKEHREMAREVASKSIILLKNENNSLPLNKSNERIAVIGPLADNPLAMLGDYHFPTHTRTFKVDVNVVTVLEGIKNKVKNVIYAKGSEVNKLDLGLLNEAKELASKANVIIGVVGDMSCIFDPEMCTSGEGVDRADIELPEPQTKLIEELSSLGKPIILVVIAGRPMSLEKIINKVDAVLWAWKLGEEGGNAIADVIFGEVSPSGRLPVSLPKSTGQIPVYYSRKPSSFGKYIESSSDPLFPFGYGLTYSKVSYNNFKILTPEVRAGEDIKLSLEVKNEGKYEVDEVIQVYISRRKSNVALPVKELKAFIKVNLRPNEVKKITFAIPTDLLAFYDKDLKLILQSGEYKVIVAKNALDSVFEGSVKLVETKELTKRNNYFSSSSIS